MQTKKALTCSTQKKILAMSIGFILMGGCCSVNATASPETSMGEGIRDGGVKYISVNSEESGNADNKGATEAEAIAIGPNAKAAKISAVSIGSNSKGEGEGAVVIGKDAVGSYNGSVAIGNGAKGMGTDGGGVSHYAGTSIAIGENTSAMGGSVAIGEKASGVALGDLALGRGAQAKGTTKGAKSVGAAISIGNWSKANGAGAVALGLRSRATKAYAIAIGGSGTTKADGENAIAMGLSTWALRDNSIAMGKIAKAQSEDAIAFGHGAIADGLRAISLGPNAHASARNSVALGYLSSTDGSYGDTVAIYSGVKNTDSTMGVVSVGYKSFSATKKGERRIVNVAGGMADTDAVNVAQLKAVSDQIGYTVGDDGMINNGGKKTVLARLDALEAGGVSSDGYTKPEVDTKLSSKADVNGANIDASMWAGKLGTGVVEKDNKDLVTGGTVFDAIKGLEAAKLTLGNVDKNIVITDNEGKTNINLAKDVKVNSITANAYMVGDKTYVSEKGLDANGMKVTGVAAGTELTDAVNYEQLQGVQNRIVGMDTKMNEIGAGSAALAALHPLEYDSADKWNFAAGIGHYDGEYAAAIGAFYRPSENLLISMGGTFGNGDSMMNVGVSLKLGEGQTFIGSKITMAKEIDILKHKNEVVESKNAVLEEEVATLREELDALKKLVSSM